MKKLSQSLIVVIFTSFIFMITGSIALTKDFCGIQIEKDTKISSKDYKPMQLGLKERNLYSGPIDGQFGPSSCLAFHQFFACESESLKNLTNKDINNLIFLKDFNSDAFQDTWQCYRQSSYVLESESETQCPKFSYKGFPALGPNDKLKYVKKNQKLLKNLNIYKGKVDGRMTKKTKVAFLNAELIIHPYNDKVKACLSDLEFKWLELIYQIKKKNRITCSSPNSLKELEVIKKLLTEFRPSLSNISLDSNLGKRKLVAAIADYEAEVNNKFV